MFSFRAAALAVLLASAVCLSQAAPLGLNSDGDKDRPALTEEMDRAIKPGDDFYRYANGGWLKMAAIPAGQTSFDTRAILVAKTSRRVRDLIRSEEHTSELQSLV